MFHKCLLIKFAVIFIYFCEILSGLVAFVGYVFLRKALISESSAQRKSNEIEESKLFLSLVYLGVSRFF